MNAFRGRCCSSWLQSVADAILRSVAAARRWQQQVPLTSGSPPRLQKGAKLLSNGQELRSGSSDSAS